MTQGERRDPRSRRQGARLSLDRSERRDEGAAGTAPELRRIPDPKGFVLAVLDLEGGRLGPLDRDVLGAARILADPHGVAVAALAFDAAPEIDFGAAGADRVLRLDLGGYVPEARTAAVVAIVGALAPKHVLFGDDPTGGGDIGRRVAACLGERPATAIRRLEATEVTRLDGGGRLDLTRAPPRFLLLLPGAAEPVTRARHEALPLAAPAFEPALRLGDRGLMPADACTVPLAEATLICSAGNGVTDWEAFRAVADALGAPQAGSRVVCDASLLPRDRQVGASGTLVEARCYLAFGISGAPQHLQGIARCEYVIAVNTDPHASIMKRADLAIVADAQAVMPALARLLESEKSGDGGHGD